MILHTKNDLMSSNLIQNSFYSYPDQLVDFKILHGVTKYELGSVTFNPGD